MKVGTMLLSAAVPVLALSSTAMASFTSLTASPTTPWKNQFHQGTPFTQPLGGHLILHNITADPGGWAALLAAYSQVAHGGWDFNNDPNYPIQGFGGPLTSAGAGPVSPGILSPDVAMHAQTDLGGNDLVTVGPPSGFGNPENAVLANTFVDSFELHLNWDGSGPKTAVEFDLVSLLGSGVVDITVDGVLLASGVAAPAGGNRWGILDTLGAGFSHIDLFDPGNGAEGVMGVGKTYVVPTPGVLALLGLAGLVGRRRRR